MTTTPLTRVDIEVDSTAVLAFDDGVRIPCDRFVMRANSGVIRRLLEDEVCRVDEIMRTIVPVPGKRSEPFWTAVDLLHGIDHAWSLDLPTLLDAMDALSFLECTKIHETSTNARLWHLLRDDDVEVVVPHASRLLRDPAVAGVVMRRLIQLCPLWSDFSDTVLRDLAPDLDHQVALAVVSFAPNFFPPPLILAWVLRVCPHLAQEAGYRMASQHGVMYHPCEVPGVLRRLVEKADAQPEAWSQGCAVFLKGMIHAMEKYDAIPNQRVHGSTIKFSDVPMCSVAVCFDDLPRGALKLTSWLRLSVTADGRLDIVLRPRAIDDLSESCTSLQLRVMAFEGKDTSSCASIGEAWFLYEDIDPRVRYTLGHASATMGTPSSIPPILRTRCCVLRLDLFYGGTNVLDNPFDPSAISRSTATFLSYSR